MKSYIQSEIYGMVPEEEYTWRNDGVNKIILEGKLDMDIEMPKLMLDDRDLWSILDEYYLDGSTVKIIIEEIE